MKFGKYLIRRERWSVGGRGIELTWPADMDALLDDPETHRRFAKDEYMPYWAQPWPGCVLLAEAVLRGRPGAGRSAVEIGCGIGLVSVAAAMMGWRAVATDYDADAVAFARLNAERNGVELAGAELLDYSIPLPEPKYDLILGSDLLYERRRAEPVAKWIASALRDGGEAMVSDPNRSAAEEFPRWAESVGLRVEVESVEAATPNGLATKGRIWRVTRSTT